MDERDGILLMGYLDGALTPDETARVEAWLARDPQARRLLEEHRLVWQALGEAWSQPDVRATSGAGVVRNFRAPVTATAGAAAGAPARGPADATAESPRAPRPRFDVGARGAALLAASLVAAVALFAWWDRPPVNGLSSADQDIVAHLDLLESLDFVDKRGEQLDLAAGVELLAAFDGELPEGGR